MNCNQCPTANTKVTIFNANSAKYTGQDLEVSVEVTRLGGRSYKYYGVTSVNLNSGIYIIHFVPPQGGLNVVTLPADEYKLQLMNTNYS